MTSDDAPDATHANGLSDAGTRGSQRLQELGERLRQYRLAAGLTLAQLAAQVDFDKGYLSRIENGKRLPPLATLSQIAGVLGVEAAALLTPSKTGVAWHTPSIVRHGEKHPTVLGGTTFGYDYFALSNASPAKALQPFLFSFPEQVDKHVFFQHDGEELLYVLTGKIEWHVGGQKFFLEAGDAIHFNSQIPHRGRSLSGEATALVVMYSPGSTNENLA